MSKINARASQGEPPGPWGTSRVGQTVAQSGPGSVAVAVRRPPIHAIRLELPHTLIAVTRGALLLCCSAALPFCRSAHTPHSSTPPPTPAPTPLPACACPTRRPHLRSADQLPGQHSRHVLSASLARRLSHARRLRGHTLPSALSFLSLVIVDSFALYPGYTPYRQWPPLPRPPRHGSSPATRASRTSSKVSSAKILSVLRYVLPH
jgi:hypothetical protein